MGQSRLVVFLDKSAAALWWMGGRARKPTLLYAFGVKLPELIWGHTEAKYDPLVVARIGLKRAKRLGEVGARGGGTDSTARIHTPIPFRNLLITMAKTV